MKKKILRVLSFCLILCSLFVFLSYFLTLQEPSDTLRIRGYQLEEKNSLDVVYIGASELFTSIIPGRAYEKYGFTSYPYAVNGMSVTSMKLALHEVLATQSPKMVVIEVNSITYTDEQQLEEHRLRRVADNASLSLEKIKFIQSTIEKDARSSYYIPLIKYHSSWENFLPDCAMTFSNSLQNRWNGNTYLRGFSTIAYVAPAVEAYKDTANDRSTAPLGVETEQIFRDFLEDCKQKGIENILFVRGVHRMDAGEYLSFQKANAVEEIIAEYGYPFMNFDRFHTEIGIDDAHDFYNNQHLNIWGAEKFSDYFCEYLTTNFQVQGTEHSEEVKDSWQVTIEKTNQTIALAKELAIPGRQGFELYEYALQFGMDSVSIKKEIPFPNK